MKTPPETPSAQRTREIQAGQIWQVTKTDEFWEILEENYDGPGTYRTALLKRGERTETFDTVWGAELVNGAVQVCTGCFGPLDDDMPGPGCESWYVGGRPVYGDCDGREL